MRARTTRHSRPALGWALLALALGAWRCDACAPGLGYGVDLAALTQPSPVGEAEAIRALVRVQGDPFGPTPATVPVVGRRGDRLLLLLAGSSVRPGVFPGVQVTYHDAGGRGETVQGAEILAGADVREGILLLAAPRPSFEVPLAVLSEAEVPDAEAGTQRLVLHDKEGRPLVRSLAEVHRARETAGEAEYRVQQLDQGGVLLDARSGHVTGVRRRGLAVERGATPALTPAVARTALAGIPRRITVEASPECLVTVRATLDDPLRTIPEIALLASKPGLAVEIPAPVGPTREGGRPQEELGSALPGGVGKVVARGRPDATGEVTIAAELPRCDERYLQVVLLGAATRWLSWPYRVPAPGAAPKALAAGRDGWRIERIPAGKPLEWPVIAAGEASAPMADPGCLPPAATLDPEAVSVLDLREAEPDPRCVGARLAVVAGRTEDARCLAADEVLLVRPDGAIVYVEERGKVPTLRLAVSDAIRKEPAGGCRPEKARLNDELVAVSPCGRDVFGSPAAIRSTYTGPGGALLFACDGGYVREDGTLLDLAGAKALVRLGDDGYALVRLPWASLAVLGRDGKGIEVSGLPPEAIVTGLMPSAATPEGFLIAVERRMRQGRGRWQSHTELYAISRKGVATLRGVLARPQSSDASPLLDPAGGLWSAERGADAPVKRTLPGAEPEPRASVVPRAVAASGRPGDRPARTYAGKVTFVSGWRSAGPAYAPELGDVRSSPEEAAKRFRPVPRSALPCAGRLDALDPAAVYGIMDGRVFDPEDPERASHVALRDGRILSDGRVAAALRDRPGDPEVLRVVPLDAHAHRPDGGECRWVPALEQPGATFEGGTCGKEGRLERFAGRPDAVEPALECALWSGPPEVRIGGRVVPGYGLRAAGNDGRLLLEERTGWAIVDRSGRRKTIKVPWTTVRAIRAMPAGFAVAVEQATPRGRTFELYQVADDGRVRRAGAYRAFDALEPKAEVTSAALGPDGALWLAVSRWPSLLAIERAMVGATESRRVWSAEGHPTALKLLTGP